MEFFGRSLGVMENGEGLGVADFRMRNGRDARAPGELSGLPVD